MSLNITLRPFQIRAVEQYRAAFGRSPAHIGIAPTGFGKSIFAGFLAANMCPRGWRVVMIAHREALVDQNAKKAKMVAPSLVIGKEIAGDRILAGDLPATDFISTCIASLRAKRAETCADLWRSDGRKILLITDEAHHCLADSYLSFYKLINPDKHLGLTATPFRGDGENLRAVFPEVGFEIDKGEMVDDGWLARPHHFCIATTTSLRDVKTRGGDYVEGQLAQVIDNLDRNDLIVAAAGEADEIVRDQHGQSCARAVCFTASVDHAHHLADRFTGAGWRAFAIDAKTPIPDRRAADDALRSATQKTVICSCGVLTEGWDVEEVNLGIFARPTKSPVLCEQMTGRVLRHLPTKKTCLLLDFQDLYADGRQTIAMSWGLPHLWDCYGGDLRGDRIWLYDAMSKVTLSTQSKLWQCRTRPEVEIVLKDPKSRKAATLDRTYLWWDLGPEYRMATNQGTVVVYRAPQGDYVAEWRRGLEVCRIDTCNVLDQICGSAEMWLDQYYPDDARFMRGRERWEPPTDKQMAYLKRHGIDVPENITKHQVSQMINEERMRTNKSTEGGYVTFGKYKGWHVTELPSHYLRWATSPDRSGLAHRPEHAMFIAEIERRTGQRLNAFE